MFAIWQLMKAHISSNEELLIGSLRASSILLFSGHEVFKMISQALFFRRLDRVLSSEVNDDERGRGWQIAWREHSAKESRIWITSSFLLSLQGLAPVSLCWWCFYVACVQASDPAIHQ